MFNSPDSQRRNFFKPGWAALAVLCVAGLAAGTSLALTDPPPADKPGTNAAPQLKVEHAPIDRAHTPVGSFAPIVQKVAPSVVEVFVTTKGGAQQSQMSEDESDLFQRFFGQQQQQGRRAFPGNNGNGNRNGGNNGEDSFAPRQHGLGSGVIVSQDGYVLTNRHVVDNASEIRVALSDGREFPAKLIGADEKTDVAVIKIDAKDLPAITFADSTELAVGDVVLAVGNPFGIGQTVTQGIVSAKDRVTSGGAMDEDFIQTDAAINPGNSGGALVDTDGRLVGINTSILSRSGGNQGIGFAIPTNLCQWVMTSLVKTGSVERGYLGVSIQSLTPQLAAQFKLDKITGALVSDVSSSGPAEKAGFKSGDVIREFNGQPVKDSAQFKLQVAETAPGTKVAVKLIRDGADKSLDVTLNDQPGQHLAKRDRSSGDKANRHDALDGVAVDDLTGNLRRDADVPDNVHGALITQVDPGSAAFEAGLRQGDVLVEINHQSVKSAQDAVDFTSHPASNQTLVKVWNRQGVRYLSVEENNVG